MKKAQGMPMNVIIIAALALIVLVILAVVFVNRTGVVVKETDRCENNGGVCVDDDEDCGPYQVERTGLGYICPDDMKCCAGLNT